MATVRPSILVRTPMPGAETKSRATPTARYLRLGLPATPDTDRPAG
ncbi:hypothetical protein [Streptomyces sp. NPDC001816]